MWRVRCSERSYMAHSWYSTLSGMIDMCFKCVSHMRTPRRPNFRIEVVNNTMESLPVRGEPIRRLNQSTRNRQSALPYTIAPLAAAAPPSSGPLAAQPRGPMWPRRRHALLRSHLTLHTCESHLRM